MIIIWSPQAEVLLIRVLDTEAQLPKEVPQSAEREGERYLAALSGRRAIARSWDGSEQECHL